MFSFAAVQQGDCCTVTFYFFFGKWRREYEIFPRWLRIAGKHTELAAPVLLRPVELAVGSADHILDLVFSSMFFSRR